MGWGFAGHQKVGMGQEKFSLSCGDGVKQNHARQGQKPHPSNPTRPIAIPIPLKSPNFLKKFNVVPNGITRSFKKKKSKLQIAPLKFGGV